MKTRHFALSAMALALSATGAFAYQGVATGDVNMREGPSTSYQVITTLPEGAPVEVLGCAGWCEVEFDGMVGYVSGNYIAPVQGAAVTRERVIVRQAPPTVYYDDYVDYDYDYAPPYYYGAAPSFGFYYDNDRRYYRDRDRRDYRRDVRRDIRRDLREERRDVRQDRREIRQDRREARREMRRDVDGGRNVRQVRPGGEVRQLRREARGNDVVRYRSGMRTGSIGRTGAVDGNIERNRGN